MMWSSTYYFNVSIHHLKILYALFERFTTRSTFKRKTTWKKNCLKQTIARPSCPPYQVSCCYSTYSSGKRTKKLFIPNIGVSRTCQKHSESNRENGIFGGHHSQVRQMYALCEVTRNGNIIPWRQCFSRSDAKFLGVIWLNTCLIFIYIYLFNKVI